MKKVGIAFYTKESYSQLLKEADDRETLHASYKDWLKDFKRLKATLRQQGLQVETFPVDLARLRIWCLLHHLPNTSANRSRWVSESLTNSLGSSKPKR